ncbi:MAG TPA: tripartite tricarboxylate transporter substrate-binding protein [Alphaproteobacteria bacterium]|jgi:tripartite-type tricarboxylate transporter receptor subunit TctC
MRSTFTRATLAAVASLAFAAVATSAQAQDFKGKIVTIGYGGGVGGGFDTYAQLLAPHFMRHLPGNPRVIVQGVPGAGTLAAANYTYEVAPHDGTFIGIASGNTATAKLFKTPNIRFDPNKFVWLGSMTSEVAVVIAWHTTGITSFDDVKTRKMIVGGGGATSGNVISPTVMNRMFGTKFEIIRGYPSSREAILAVERGELDGVASWNYSSIKASPALLREGKIKILLQLALSKHPDLPDVPLITDLARTPEEKAILELIFAPQEMGRPLFLPPATPAAVAAVLRRAFDATLADPDFKADAEKRKMDLNSPMTGEQVQALVAHMHQQPEALVEKTIELTNAGK